MKDNEFYDPNNKEFVYYSEREEKSRRRRFTPVYTIFSSKKFMLGYAVFLTAAVIFITIYQKGSIKMPVFSSIKGIACRLVYSENNSKEVVTLKMKNVGFEHNIESISILARLYKNDEIMETQPAAFGYSEFPLSEIISIPIYFDKALFSESSKIEIEYVVNGVKARINEEIFH